MSWVTSSLLKTNRKKNIPNFYGFLLIAHIGDSSCHAFELKNKNALDIGSSTGGFTQILLEFDIKKVVCVDVGNNQLHEKIKKDKRIEFFENCDIRDFKSDISFDIVTCDVSFISILKLLLRISDYLVGLALI